MIIGRVVSQLFATQKNKKLFGAKLLLVQPLDLNNRDSGEVILALDSLDSGVGDRVLVVLEGWSANHAARTSDAPLDAAVVGVVDRVDLQESPD
ncbi:MAG: EutN/CcmL family microcompartment protein [Acidobacteria bacterium]|nr:EutN/CcmL family microcompartment protein [Acidobacteriota bacterium]